jgi:hypothetical protein
VVGFALDRLSLQARTACAVLSLAVVLPPEAFAGAIWINAAALAGAAALLGLGHIRRRAARPQREEA